MIEFLHFMNFVHKTRNRIRNTFRNIIHEEIDKSVTGVTISRIYDNSPQTMSLNTGR